MSYPKVLQSLTKAAREFLDAKDYSSPLVMEKEDALYMECKNAEAFLEYIKACEESSHENLQSNS